jgi:hypothetical protein
MNKKSEDEELNELLKEADESIKKFKEQTKNLVNQVHSRVNDFEKRSLYANDYTKKEIQEEKDDLISQLKEISEELDDNQGE